jgi:hypothetical protein
MAYIDSSHYMTSEFTATAGFRFNVNFHRVYVHSSIYARNT